MQHAKTESIEEYRRRRRRKRFYKKIIAAVLILAMLTLVLFIVKVYLDGDIFKPTDSSQATSFPLTLKDEQLMDIYKVNKSLATLSKSGVKFYDQNGKEGYKFVHGYTNPIIDSNDKRTIVFDAGSNKIRVDTIKDKVGEIKTDGNILFAKMSNAENFAVVTSSERYASVVTVYDKKLKPIFEWSNANEQVISLCFSKNNKSFYAATLVSFDGILGINIYKLNISEEKEIFKTEVKNIVPLSMDYKDEDNITIVGKDSAVTVDMNGAVKNSYIYNQKLLGFDNSLSSACVIALEDVLENKTKIVTLDNIGKEAKSLTIDDKIKDINVSQTRIAVLGKHTLYNCDLSLNLLNTIVLENTATRVKIIDNNVYTMGLGFVNKENID
ncbi:MAG: DUF5711 family protein [Oscillospiraceae bacterium]